MLREPSTRLPRRQRKALPLRAALPLQQPLKPRHLNGRPKHPRTRLRSRRGYLLTRLEEIQHVITMLQDDLEMLKEGLKFLCTTFMSIAAVDGLYGRTQRINNPVS